MSVASARPRESLAGSTSLPAAGRFLLDLFDRFLIGRVRFRFADTEISSGTADGPETTLRIHDDGRGFDTGSVTAGMGLNNMRERAQAIGATFRITSQSERGTEIIIHRDTPPGKTASS